jgi:hypothetical protein
MALAATGGRTEDANLDEVVLVHPRLEVTK